VTISHVHCRMRNLSAAVEWFSTKCGVAPTFDDERTAVLSFGSFTLILDAAADDSVATIGFDSTDCDADFAVLTSRGARMIEPPEDRPYGARVAYLQGPGSLTVELEQMLPAPA
jgi:uncharacterized glyoxalase superfamily protein PhnB